MEHLRNGRTLEAVGQEIKDRMQSEIGDWLTCKVGIGTNRFLAKLAASLHKPDGLDTISHENLREIYSQVKLLDLCGINTRNKARLNFAGIYEPIEFLDAPVWKLWKQVFGSVQGRHWYMRLRGYEVDNISYGRRSYGQSYALHYFTNDTVELSKLMMKLCEKMGRRLRRSGNYATGIHVHCGFRGAPWWHKGQKTGSTLYATTDLHAAAMRMLRTRPMENKVTHLSVSCYGLHPIASIPPTLFETDESRAMRMADAMDQANDQFGEYVLTPASMMGMEQQVVKRVPFHATTDTLSEIYEDSEPTSMAE